jgi:hypothetical protein
MTHVCMTVYTHIYACIKNVSIFLPFSDSLHKDSFLLTSSYFLSYFIQSLVTLRIYEILQNSPHCQMLRLIAAVIFFPCVQVRKAGANHHCLWIPSTAEQALHWINIVVRSLSWRNLTVVDITTGTDAQQTQKQRNWSLTILLVPACLTMVAGDVVLGKIQNIHPTSYPSQQLLYHPQQHPPWHDILQSYNTCVAEGLNLVWNPMLFLSSS